MGVFKATDKKSDSAGKFKATEKRSYDSALVYDWETRSKEARDILEQYRIKVNNGGYLSTEDLAAYQKALDDYEETSNSLRSIVKVFGSGDSVSDMTWNTTMSKMRKNYQTMSEYYSKWKTEDDYKAAIAQAEKDERLMKELLGDYDPVKNKQDAQTAWGEYQQMQERIAQNKAEAEANKTVWDKIGGWLGTTPQGGLDIDTNQIAEGYIEQDINKQKPDDRWTEDQQLAFAYLWNQDRTKARQYAYAVNTRLDAKQEQEQLQKIQDWATDNFGAGVVSTVGAVVSSQFGLADYLGDIIQQGAVGHVDEYDGDVSLFEYSQAVTGGISQHLNELGGTLNEDIPIIGGKGWGDVYGLNNSILQSALAAYTGGGGQALITAFGSAAASGVDDAIKRGASGEQAVLYGTAVGAAEAIAEKIGVDNLMKIGASSTLKQLFINVLKQGGAEGIEEGLTSVLGNVADNIIMGDKSNFYLRVEAYISAGMNEDEAKKKAWSEMVGDIAYDSVAGFVSGAVHAGPQTTYQTLVQNAETKNTYGGSQKELVGEALEINPDNAYAKKMQGRLDKGKNLTGGQLSNLVRQNNESMTEQDRSKLKKAIEARLVALGETGDVSALAEALTKQAENQTDYSKVKREMDRLMAKGYSLAEALEMAAPDVQNLSHAEENLIASSQYGQRVSNELNVENIRSGNYSSQWTGDINTDRIHADVYNNDLMDLAMETSGATAKTTPEASQVSQAGQGKEIASAEGNLTTQKETTSESHYEVSDDGKMVNNKTGDIIEPQGLVQGKDGKYKIAVKDGDPVSNSDVSYADNDQALVYETFVNLEGKYGKTNKVIGNMDLDSRNALLGLYNREINKNGGIFVNGAVSSFFYGHQGIDLSAVPKTSPVWELSEQQRKIAWNQGRIAGVKAINTAQSNVDTVYEEAQKVLKQEGKAKGSYSAVLEAGITPMQLNEKQKAVYRLADDIAQAVQTNIHVYEGKNKAQGFYDHKTDEIWLNLNAANTSREAIMAFTLAHELVHRAKKGSPAKYKVFTEFLMKEYGKQGTNVEALIAEQMVAAEEFNKTVPDSKKVKMTREKAFEEVVCDTCQRMLLDTNAGQKLAEFGAQSKQNKSFLDDLKRWISEFFEKLRNYFKGVDPDSKAAKEFAKFDDNVKQILADMYVDMSIEAGEKLSTIKAAYGGAFASKFLGLKDVQYNLAAVETHKDKLQKEYSEDSSTDLNTIMARYDKIIDIWKRLGGELNSKFLADWNSKVSKDRTFTIFKAQAGYKYNVELSSMCKKGVPLFEAIDTIVKQEVMKELNLAVLGKAEKEILYDILKQHNFEIPCAICYVEQARQREGVVIDAFLNGKVDKNAKGETTKVKLGWNQVLDSIAKEMKANGVDYTFAQVSRDIATDKYSPANLTMDEKTTDAFYATLKKVANQEITRYNKAEGKSRKLLSDVTPEAVKECFKGTLPANLKIFKVLFEEPSSRFKITSDLLYSSVATQNLSRAHNKLYGLFNSQGGVSGYKTKQGTTIYWGDILGKSWKPDTLRNEGGVRNQSNSDFQIYTLLDHTQMYIDFTAKGYYLQAYTKVLSELKLFGLSRGKINASLIPKVVVYLNADGTVDVERTMATAGLDENGNPIYDDIEGINHNEAFMLIEDPEYSKSICGICIGYSDAHIFKLLDDNRVQQIIGFHDKTDDGSKRYKGARYAKNYNGLNEAVDKEGKTKHIGFNTYVKKAENKFKFNAETETFEGTINYNGKTYTADDIPRLAADLYLEMCAKRGYTPAYNDFKGHPNYYKLLADFGLYDSQGHYAPHRKVVYNMPDTVPYLDANGKKQTMSTYDYIKAELVKEMAVRDSISEALADTSSEGIIPQFKAAVKKNQAAKSQAEDSQEEKSFSLPKGEPAPTFYSLMARVVDGLKQEKFGASTVVNTLRNKGVKAEEIKWSGIEEFLEGKKSVTKAELQEFIAGSMLQIEEETLDNMDRPYTEDQQKRLDEYEAKRDEVAKRLADEWNKITGKEFPVRNLAADFESAVVNKIIDENKAHKDATFEGRLLKKLGNDLRKVIEDNDDFGFDSPIDALRSIHRHRRDFINRYEMSTNDKAVIVKYCNALNAYNELPNRISEEDTDRLRAISREGAEWNRKIANVVREHDKEQEKYATNWGEYRLKGGKNYREMLFRIPDSTYSNVAMFAHWKDRRGVLAHARIQDFNTFIGKMLFIEEIQSDWHNEGHKEGYRKKGEKTDQMLRWESEEAYEEFYTAVENMVTSNANWEDDNAVYYVHPVAVAEMFEGNESHFDKYGFTDEQRETIRSMVAEEAARQEAMKTAPKHETVPDAPFKDTYHEYVLKRLLRMAAEEGYDSIGWTTSETQDERWKNDQPHKEGTGKSGFLKAYINEYDQRIKKFLSDFGKKWGTTVGKTVLDNGTEVWSMAITDEMKESVLYEGQVVYSLPKIGDKKPPTTLTEEDLRELLQKVKSKGMDDGTYFPVRINTPDVLLDAIKEIAKKLGITNQTEIEKLTKDRPMAIQVYKARKSLSSPVEWDGEGTPHDLSVDDFVGIIKKMEEPEYIVYEAEEGRYVEILRYKTEKGKYAYAVVELENFKGDRHMNGYGYGTYNMFVTVYQPDSYKRIENLLKKEGNIVITPQKNKGNLQLTSSIHVPSVLNKLPFAPSLPQDNESVNTDDIDYKLPIGEDTSPRALLSNAFEGIITNDIEKRRIQEYKGKVDMLNAEEEKLRGLRAHIKKLSFAKGPRDTKKIKELQFDAAHTANRIATLDKMLLRLEAAAPLQNILKREKEMAYKRAEQKGKEDLEAYKKAERERDQKWQSEVKEKYQASKKKAIETREKREAREKLQKLVLDTVKWISYPSKTDVKCPDLLKQPYADFLNGIDMSSKRLADGGDPTKADLRLANAMGSLATALERVMTSQDPTQETTAVLDTGYLDLPANFVEKLRDMTEDVKKMMVEGEYVVNNMTAAEVRQLSQMIRTLNHAIREVSTLYANLRFANIEELGDNTMSFMDALGEIEKTSGMKDFVQWDNALPYYAFKRFGDGGQSIFEGLMDAQDKLAFLSKTIFSFSDKAWTDKEAKAWSEDTHTIDLPNGNTLTLTTADAMSIYCLSRREQGLQHLLGGGTRVIGIQKGSQKAKDSRSTLTIEDISAIVSSLTDRQKAVAENIQEFMSTVCSDWGNEISMKRFLTKEFNEKFYFPIESNDENLPTKDPAAQQSDLFRLLNISATKPLDPRANNEVIIRNIFDVFANHSADMARLNAYGMALLDYMKWLNYREKTVNDEGQITVRGVRKSMEKAYGKAANSYVLNLIKDVNGRPSDGGLPSFYTRMLRNAKTAMVGNSLRVATLQITSYPRAALVLSPKSLALGLTKKPQIEKAKKYCGIALWKSFGFYDTNIARSVEEQIKGVKNVKQKLIELSLKGAEWGDALTWGCLWNACEYEVAKTTKNKVGSEEFYQEVGKKLREVVYRTQVVDSTLTRSEMMRSKNAKAQELSAFMSEPTLSANILMDAGFEFQLEKRRTGSAKAAWKKTGKYVTKAIAVYSIGQLAAALLESLWDAWRDDEDEEFGEKYKDAFTKNLILDLLPINKIPIISDLAEALLSMVGIGYFSSDSLSSTALSQTVSAIKAWSDVLGGDSSTTAYNAIYKTVRAISSFSGIAFGGVMREGVALWNNTAGKYDVTWKVQQYDRSKTDLGNLLYDAMVSGDDRQAESILEEFRDRAEDEKEYQSSVNSAIRKALRENDPRIKEAAQAVVDGNAAQRANIVREIVAEGNFSLQDIQAAINAEIDKLRKEAKG